MRSLPRHPFTLAILASVWLASTACADPAVPGSILDPKTAPEAWNVIRLATKNIDQLIAENRLSEIPVQASFSSPSLRTLVRLATTEEAAAQAESQTARAIEWLGAVARGAEGNSLSSTKDALDKFRLVLSGIARHFDPKELASEIFFCRLHPDFVSDKAATPCGKCGTPLLPRRIPYSFIYMKPGEPTIRMTTTQSAPIEAGKSVEIGVRLEKADKSPVTTDDLLVTHGQPIHLLMEDPSLGDFHDEHPTPTKTPGEYVFSFTPAKTAPYRIWADLTPAATGLQELPFADLSSSGKGTPIENKGGDYISSAGGYTFTLTLGKGNHIPIQAGQPRGMTVKIADATGKPTADLEPILHAFAHLVGFYDDYKTVLHVRPSGGDILNPDRRGGPALTCVFFPPKAGFMRLYCQVRVGGKTLVAPFNVNVEP